MERDAQYLLDIKADIREDLANLTKTLDKHKLVLFWASIGILSLYFLEIKASSFTFLGFSVSDLDFSKLSFLIPVIITYEFTYYTLTRLKFQRAAFRLRAIESELESKTHIDVEKLVESHPYVSRRGTVYKIRESDRFFRYNIHLMNFVRWLPVVFVFVLGGINGLRSASSSTDHSYRIFYYTVFALCCMAIVLAQITKMFAYRTNIRQQPSSNKQQTPANRTNNDAPFVDTK